MTRRNGAGGFRCLSCHTPLADVRRRLDGTPFLSIRLTVKVRIDDEGAARLSCPKCGTVRRIRWRVLPGGEG